MAEKPETHTAPPTPSRNYTAAPEAEMGAERGAGQRPQTTFPLGNAFSDLARNSSTCALYPALKGGESESAHAPRACAPPPCYLRLGEELNF